MFTPEGHARLLEGEPIPIPHHGPSARSPDKPVVRDVATVTPSPAPPAAARPRARRAQTDLTAIQIDHIFTVTG